MKRLTLRKTINILKKKLGLEKWVIMQYIFVSTRTNRALTKMYCIGRKILAYEIDFIGVASEVKKDADAVVFRWQDDVGNYKIAIYDGGLQAHGEKMVQHLNEYYFSKYDKKVIDCVICSHSDLDHASGLKSILDEFEVKKLYMNRPWLYVDDVWNAVKDGRITKDSLIRRLKENYKYISDLEDIANEKGIDICEAFQGKVIEDRLEILSPSKDFYLELMVESTKTLLEENNTNNNTLKKFAKGLVQYVKNLVETWIGESLREDVVTSAENEMSVVILGKMDEENFLITGDAGIRALDKAIVYSDDIDSSIKDTVNFMQIPHHGGRHNVSPSILNRLVGEIVEEGVTIGKTAFVSVAKDSNHPLQMVVNGFVRRGVKVYKTEGNIIRHHRNMPNRSGWTALTKLEFEEYVEEWEN